MNEAAAAPFAIRAAVVSDAPAVAACVCEAYVHYIERIGKQPAPMLEDYVAVIAGSIVHVAVQRQRVVGAIVAKITPEGFYIDNVAVRPEVQGRGVGRALLDLAEREALQRGYAFVYLATHELMVENRALYQHIGYVEFDRRVVSGYPRVFLRKALA